MRYAGEWEIIVERLGRWIDFKNDYKTMYPWFMESIWWVFKQIYEKGLIYRGYKVLYSYFHTFSKYYYLQWKPLKWEASGVGILSRLSVSRLTDVNYTIRYEFVSKTSSRLTEYPVYPSPD